MKICSALPRGKAYQFGRWPLEAKFRFCLAMVVANTIMALNRVDPKLIENIPLGSLKRYQPDNLPQVSRPNYVFRSSHTGPGNSGRLHSIHSPSRCLLHSSHLHETCHFKEFQRSGSRIMISCIYEDGHVEADFRRNSLTCNLLARFCESSASCCQSKLLSDSIF